jgi:predicted Rossmann fold flavoprotein
MTNNINAIVVGAGAAGCFAAINLKLNFPNAQVLILEKNSKYLQKVKVSGGGRCNVTHKYSTNNIFAQNYPRGQKELVQAFAQFNAQDCVEWFQNSGVKLHTESDGRMFPVSNNSQTIIDLFEELIHRNNIKLYTNQKIESVEKLDSHFLVNTQEKQYTATHLIICTGGSNKVSDYGFLKTLSHTIISPVASLFTFNVKDTAVHSLMGLSLPMVKCNIVGSKVVSTGPLLFTHWGFSGPAILKLSAIEANVLFSKNYDFAFRIDFLPNETQEALFDFIQNHLTTNYKKKISNISLFQFPLRFWLFVLQKAQINEDTFCHEIGKKQVYKLIEILKNAEFKVMGKTTFKEEFVTCGGITLKEIDIKRMESKLHKNLFFAGEVLNIDGITGGFNFQSAWTTAFVAAKLAT